MGQVRLRGTVYWVRWYRDGKRYEESSHSSRKEDAKKLLKLREGDVAKGVPLTAKIGQLRVDEALRDVITDYRINGKRSLAVVERRVEKHLLPYFAGRRMAAITTADVRKYVAQRQAETTIVRKAYTMRGEHGVLRTIPESRRTVSGVSNAEINRELTTLKRAFNLAVQGGKLLAKPHIPMLKEGNARTGFFERGQFESVRRHLPADLHPLITFAYITGWRVASEIQPLQWSQVDFAAGEVRLNPGTTKNGEGRVFPMTRDLRTLLEGQWKERQRLAAEKDRIVPWVFHRNGKPITAFTIAWRHACVGAGCPGRIPHDFRRTAVRNLVRAGIPERVAMTMTGHKTRSIFERYNIVSSGDLRDAAKRLDEATGTKQGQSTDQPTFSATQPNSATASQSVA